MIFSLGTDWNVTDFTDETTVVHEGDAHIRPLRDKLPIRKAYRDEELLI